MIGTLAALVTCIGALVATEIRPMPSDATTVSAPVLTSRIHKLADPLLTRHVERNGSRVPSAQAPVVAKARTTAAKKPAAKRPPAPRKPAWRLQSTHGYDISWPQCGGRYPGGKRAFGLVGVTGGRIFTTNPCLRSQWAWARNGASAGSVYVNLDYPTVAQLHKYGYGCSTTTCALKRTAGRSVQVALSYARRQGVSANSVWLDVEMPELWSTSAHRNAVFVQGALDELARRGLKAGIYSTSLQFRHIVGGWKPAVPSWFAVGDMTSKVRSTCGRSFTRGPVLMVQWLDSTFDENYACPALTKDPTRWFRP